MTSFKSLYTFDERKSEAERIVQKYPERIPVIVVVENNNGIFSGTKKLPELSKYKYLSPADFTVGQFMFTIRKSLQLKPETAIFCLVNDQIPPTSSLMSQVYDEHKDEDLFLYMNIVGENTFGSF